MPKGRQFSSSPAHEKKYERPQSGSYTWTRIGHGKKKGLVVFQFEVLVLEFLAIDRLSPSTISSSEIAALNHEAFDDSMENGPYTHSQVLNILPT